MAGESPFEPLPAGSKARLGRGTAVTVRHSPDGARLAVGGNKGIWLYDTRTDEVESLLTGHEDEAWSVEISPDGRTLVGRDGRFTVRLWDVATGTLRLTLEAYTTWGGRASSMDFSSDGQTLASGSLDGTILLWDVVSDAAAGDFLNLATNPDGYWEAWRSGTMVTISFGSPRTCSTMRGRIRSRNSCCRRSSDPRPV